MHPFLVHKCIQPTLCAIWKCRKSAKRKHTHNAKKAATTTKNIFSKENNTNKNAKIKWMKSKIDIDLHIPPRQHNNCIITI